MKDSSLAVFGCIGLAVSFVGALVIESVIGGWVFSILWGWFMVPAFGLPPLSVPMAMGVGMVVGYAAKYKNLQPSKDDKANEDRMLEVYTAIITTIIYYVMTLGIGWIILQFI